jgi:hypothetical protein
MFRLKMNFTGDVPEVYSLVNKSADIITSTRNSGEIYKDLKLLTSSEFMVIKYLNKINFENGNNCKSLATLLLDFQLNYKKAANFLDSDTQTINPQYEECCKNSVIALQATQVFLAKVISKEIDGSEFSEKSYMLMRSLKPDIEYLFSNFSAPYFNKNGDFIHQLSQGIISLGEQLNIDIANSMPSKAIVAGPRSPDACLLQLIILMKESGLKNPGLINEASDIFKSGVVSGDVVNAVIGKFLDNVSKTPDKTQSELCSQINKIKSGLDFISNKKLALSLAHGGNENIIKHRELDLAKNAVNFDSMFTRLYESSLAFKLEKSLQSSSEFEEKMLSPLIAALKMFIEKTVAIIEKDSTTSNNLKDIKNAIQEEVMDFNLGHELGDIKNVPSLEMRKNRDDRDCRELDALAFLKAELKCINEIETQRDNGDVDMIGIMPHISLGARFTNQGGHIKSAVPDTNQFYQDHINPSKKSRECAEDRVIGERIIRRHPVAKYSNLSLTNVTANHYGSMSAGHIYFYPDGINKNPEKPNFRTHNSFFNNVKIDRFSEENIRISEENQFILDNGLLLASGVSGTVWSNVGLINDMNACISNNNANKVLSNINEKLFLLQTSISMVQLGGHSLYEALWSIKEAISQGKILKGDLNAKKILSNDATKTENGLEMSIIPKNQMLRFLMSDIEDGEAICTRVEDDAFSFVQEEFKKHDKYYQKI